MLLRHPSVDVIASAGSFAAARDALGAARLVFFEPDACGDGILDWLVGRPPQVDFIVTSTDDRWSLTAFEFGALDYVLKPVCPARLGVAMRRMLRLDWASVPGSGARMFVSFERGRRVVTIDEICAIRSLGNYTQVMISDGTTEVVLRSLLRWTDSLPAGSFVRVHRALLVNRDRIKSLDRGPGDERLVSVEGLAEPLPVSRRFGRDILRVLQAHSL
jgi:two-component system LytT family response regulator